MTLQNAHLNQGAVLADDGIPLHYNRMQLEYAAALSAVALFDRSHEGRLRVTGSDRQTFINRMSTNKVIDLTTGNGTATLFTNANARVLFRVEVFERGDHLLLLTGPGQGEALRAFLQRNIFFNDQVQVVDAGAETIALSLHGPHAERLIQELAPETATLSLWQSYSLVLGGTATTLLRRKPMSESHWTIIAPKESADKVFNVLADKGQPWGLQPAGSLVYNALRIQSGTPASRELSTDYIPLELGLWDEISFSKGCYTGQEIIARMESRGKLARTIVSLAMPEFIAAPTPLLLNGRNMGEMTSSVQAPDGRLHAIAIVRMDAAHSGTTLEAGDTGLQVKVLERIGEQPPYLESETEDS